MEIAKKDIPVGEYISIDRKYRISVRDNWETLCSVGSVSKQVVVDKEINKLPEAVKLFMVLWAFCKTGNTVVDSVSNSQADVMALNLMEENHYDFDKKDFFKEISGLFLPMPDNENRLRAIIEKLNN